MADISSNTLDVQIHSTPISTVPNGFWDASWRALQWMIGFFDSTKPGSSMKRLTIWMAANTLCYTSIRLTHAVCHQIWYALPIDTQTVYLLALNYGILAVMAGVAYFKRDAQGNITIESTKKEDDSANS